MTTTTDTAYDRTTALIGRLVADLNDALGFVPGGGRPAVTFGYIGNIERWGDDRRWYVFLPHPGRVGTADDRLGGFATGDTAGAQRTASQLGGALTLARWNRTL